MSRDSVSCDVRRFGSPGNVETSYNNFADYYMKTFNCSTSEFKFKFNLNISPSPSLSPAGVINTLLKQLQKHRNGVYLTPRVKQLIFSYLNEA